jgi:hypothetical protein
MGEGVHQGLIVYLSGGKRFCYVIYPSYDKADFDRELEEWEFRKGSNVIESRWLDSPIDIAGVTKVIDGILSERDF